MKSRLLSLMLRIVLFLLSSSPFLLFGNAFKRTFVERVEKPCGKSLAYGFDDKGRLVSVQSPDGSLGYVYTYNSLDQVTTATNLKTGEKVERYYDECGNLLEETFPAGFCLKNHYNAEGRRIAMILPDLSYVEYIYMQSRLQKVIRKSKTDEPLYVHQYAAYDETGHVVQQELIGNIGRVTSTFDKQGRLVQLETPFGTERVQAFDDRGNVLQIDRFSGPSVFSYDEKDQLIEEQSSVVHAYTFDKHGAYDARGNTIEREGLRLTYDAFDRLISVEKPQTFRQIYTYDGFHRRLTETLYFWKMNGWEKQHTRQFLYDNQNEIGACDEEGSLVELRILGRTQNADIGAAIAMELDGKVFAPLHDLCGNVVGLVSPETQTMIETYTYHAFGEDGPSETERLSPWRYCSKRSDPLTGLVFFGRRFYDPLIRRWLTKDPDYPVDGIEPYTFVHNNPLTYIDLYGLESILSQFACWLGTIIQQYCYHVIPFPGIRNIGIYLGEALGAEPIPDSDYECFSGSVGTIRPDKKHVNVWINGLNTNLKSTVHFAQLISDAHEGEKVYFSYNCTRGFMADIWEHIAGKLFFQTSALQVAWNTLKQALKEVGGPGNGGKVSVFAHSQGGVILSRAISYLSSEEQKMLCVYTFGTGALFSQGNLAEVHHFISERDYIPFFADPLRYLTALIWGSSVVHFLPSEDGSVLDNHAFEGDVYQQKISHIGAAQAQ